MKEPNWPSVCLHGGLGGNADLISTLILKLLEPREAEEVSLSTPDLRYEGTLVSDICLKILRGTTKITAIKKLEGVHLVISYFTDNPLIA